MTDDTTRDSGTGARTRLDPTPSAAASGDAATRLDQPSTATRIDPQPRDAGTPGDEDTSLLSLPLALAERFEIERPLPTKGAEADLLLVRAPQGGERFVAKIYRHGTRPKSDVLEAVSRSNPEHVIGLREYGVSSGRAYELLEYAPFGSLRELRADGAALDTELVRVVVMELAEALQHLHEQNVIHRDLKPANVLVRSLEPLDLVLTDFGIASASEATVHYTSAHRTIAYAAPETIAGEVSAASDFWSLGIIVSELVAGRHPLHGMSEIVMQARLVSRDVPTRHLPAPWDALCAGLLQRDPRSRWQYVEVQAWLRGETIERPGRRFGIPGIDWGRVADSVRRFEIPRRRPRVPTGADRDEPYRVGRPFGADTAPSPTPPRADGPAAVRGAEASAERPYTFADGRYATPAALASALARNPREAHKHVARGYVGTWLAEEVRDYDLANRVQDLAERYAANPTVLLLAVTSCLDPMHEAVYHGLPLHGDALAAAVREIVLAPDSERLSVIDDVFEHDLLRLIGEARRDASLVRAAETWRRRWTALVAAVSDLRALVGIKHDVSPPAAARAMLLLATLDERYGPQVERAASKLRDRRRSAFGSASVALDRYRKAHTDPLSVDVAILALHAAKQAELDAGTATRQLLEEAGTLDADATRRLLAAGAAVDGPKPDEITPLMVAARHNRDAAVVQELIRAGANVEAGHRAGRTPLLVAARYNPSAEVVKALLAAGADVHAHDRERRTPLVRAARFNTNPDVIDALLASGAVVTDSLLTVSQSNPSIEVQVRVATLVTGASPREPRPATHEAGIWRSRAWRLTLWIVAGAVVLFTPLLWLPALAGIAVWVAYTRLRNPRGS